MESLNPLHVDPTHKVVFKERLNSLLPSVVMQRAVRASVKSLGIVTTLKHGKKLSAKIYVQRSI